MKSLICDDICFEIIKSGENQIDIKCSLINGSGQPIMTIYRLPKILYLWFNEGKFPKCLDTRLKDGRERLKITGVDEL